jgi:hypothetical protein
MRLTAGPLLNKSLDRRLLDRIRGHGSLHTDRRNRARGRLARTRRAGAHIPQEFPQISAFTVTVVPTEANAVPAHRLGFYGFGKRVQPWQHSLKCQPLWITGLPMFTTTLRAALRARTSVAQKAERVMAAMAVDPLDFETASRCQLHPHRLGITAARHSWTPHQAAAMNTPLQQFFETGWRYWPLAQCRVTLQR